MSSDRPGRAVLRIAVASGPEEVEVAYLIRHQVFVIEQAVPVELERDELDASATHLLGWHAGAAVGTVRLVAGDNGSGVLGRLAVLGPARRLGLGVALVRGVEEVGRRQGLRTIELHAQSHALEFYQRLGYSAYGPEYAEAGIPHRSMHRLL